MFDIGWSELLIIGIVALIVVGPKDLPGMFRTLGRVTGKMKGMAREFQRAMNQAADESGVKDISKEIKMAASPKKFGFDSVRSAAKEFQEGLVADDAKPTKPKPAAAKASEGSQASSEARKSDSALGGKVGNGSEATSSKVDGETAEPKPQTDEAASENPNTIENPLTEAAEKSAVRAESDGRLSSSPTDPGATVSELDEQARRAESNS